jgi:predicted molibdopterin-dependent oxidoreductase YjgC
VLPGRHGGRLKYSDKRFLISGVFEMSENHTVFINNRELGFTPGQTILEVAEANHIHIPTLCYLKNASPTESCRVCVVEVEGLESLVPSCATPARAGIRVLTDSKKVVEARKEIIAFLLASGNHNCAIAEPSDRGWTAYQLKVQKEDGAAELCPVWGDCRLQDLAYHYQVTIQDFQQKIPRAASPYPMELANPFIIRDFSRCILCGRCVKACREIQVNNAIEFGYTSDYTKIIAGKEDALLKDSDCVFCGECVQVCPVGALVEKDSRYVWRPNEVQMVKTTCPYCGVGCQIMLHVKNDRVLKITGIEASPPNYGSLCVKGRFGFNFIDSPERLKVPLVKDKETQEFKETSWDEALDLVADRLSAISRDHGPNSIGVLTSARMTNEDNYIMQKFARAVLKTNNVDHCARL